MIMTWAAKTKIRNLPVCVLSERCHSAAELQKNVVNPEYAAIVLNDNDLDDAALTHLRSLTYLERLSIAGTQIKGSCLGELLTINGLLDLNIACNESLIKGLALKSLLNGLPNSSVERLDLSGNNFDFFQLVALIEMAFQCADKRPFTLALGELRHLDNNAIVMLYNTANNYAASYKTSPTIESSAFQDYEKSLNQGSRRFSLT